MQAVLSSLSFLPQTNFLTALHSVGVSLPRWSWPGRSCNFTRRDHEYSRRVFSGWFSDRRIARVGDFQMMRWLVVLLLLLPSLRAGAGGTVTQQVTGTC